MKKTFAAVAAVSLIALSACNNTPREQAADNIEANAEMTADNLEDMAGNTSNTAMEAGLQNQADSTRAMGDNMADDMRTHDADTNLANGM